LPCARYSTPPARWRRATSYRGSAGFASERVASISGSNGVPNADDSLPPSGSTLQQAFDALVSTLNEHQARYAIIGGLATIQHGRVRTTDDIDALLSVPQLIMPGFFETLRERGFTLDVMQCVHQLRDDGLTTLRFADVLVDLMRPVLPAYDHVLDRAVDAQIFGRPVRISSVEGLIVMKLIAFRPQDEADVQDLIAAYPAGLDLKYIRTELESLADPSDARRSKFEEWVRQVEDHG
jgi:hypothetical protein